MELISMPAKMMNTDLQEKPATDLPPNKVEECREKMSAMADATVARSKEFVRQNPLPMILGVFSFGIALGYMIAVTRREEPTLGERFIDEPLRTAREAVYGALAPVAHRLHEGYDSARDGVGRTREKLLHRRPSHSVESWLDQIGRNLKFW